MGFFKRKTSNRRVTKRPRLYRMSRSVLDWFGLFAKIVLTVGVFGGLYHFFFLSNYFSLESVSVTGDFEKISKDDILKIANLKPGMNIFSVNVIGIARKMRAVAWVKDVAVRRNLPGEVVVHIEEHEPLAVLQTFRSNSKSEIKPFFYLISEEGVVFKKVGDYDGNLPVIRGFIEEKMRRFPGYYREKLDGVLEFVKAFRSDGHIADSKLAFVDYKSAEGVTVFIEGLKVEGSEVSVLQEVFFGVGDWKGKVLFWNRFVSSMQRENVFYDRVDLHIPGKVFAGLLSKVETEP